MSEEKLDIASGRAVEVAALLGDSIVAVKHVVPARPERALARHGLVAAGALLLAVSAFAFARGVGVARANRAALRQHTDVLGRPASEFRPRRLGLGYDWLAFGGLAGGLVALTWALARRRPGRAEPSFTIGRAAGVDFPTNDSPLESFPLVGAGPGGDLVVHVGPGMSAQRLDAPGPAGQASAMVAGAVELELPPGARYRVRCGLASYAIASVPAPRAQGASGFTRVERAQLAFFGGSALAHLAFLVLLYSIPPDPRSLSIDVFGPDTHMVSAHLNARETPREEPAPASTDGEQGKGAEAGAQALAGEPGKMGPDDGKGDNGRFRIKQRGPRPQLSHDETLLRARNSGILAVLGPGPRRPQAWASITGTGEFASGLDDRDVYGGYGDQDGEMRGVWGYAPEGTGPGGGGDGWDTIGVRRYDTIGYQWGPGRDAYSVLDRHVRTRPPHTHGPTVDIGPAEVPGDFKPIVRRYIHKQLARIEHCYEKELMVKPTLDGTVRTRFVISGEGSVISVRADGMGDANVESCVGDVIKSIQFPRTPGGVVINVTYPFIFHPAGA